MKKADRYTVFETEMGWMGLAATGQGLFASVLPQAVREDAELQLLSRLPFAPIFLPQSFAELAGRLQAYFRGETAVIDCEIDWSWATPFQKRVLQVVQGIPAGTCLTYGEAAGLAGVPRGARAAGGALAANMIPVVIPCHRVIRKNGDLGGFTGGSLDLKARLLSLEKALKP